MVKNKTILKAVVIEDEKPAARRLGRMLKDEGVEVEAYLAGIEEALEWFRTHDTPGVILTDIRLADGLCFDIFRDWEQLIPVIFVTAYDEYALKAFDVNSIAYLLKPVRQDELHRALQKVRRLNGRELQTLRTDIFKAPAYRKRFTVSYAEHIRVLNMEDVLAFYSRFKATFVWSKEGKSYVYDQSLDRLEKELDPDVFFRVNRSYIIHISAVKEMLRYSNSRLKIILEQDESAEIIVSRDRVKAFMQWLNK